MRSELETQTDQLLAAVVDMGEQADQMLAGALRAVADGDQDTIERVVEADREVDTAYERVQHGVLAVVALHGPVGHDLRRLTSLVHVSLHAERMGDYAVSVARTADRSARFPGDEGLTEQLTEMGGIARQVCQQAFEAFVHADADVAHRAAALDDGVDRLNIGIFHRLVRLAAEDEGRLEWATRMIGVARYLERYADHGVDVAEQALFVATGENTELSSNDP